MSNSCDWCEGFGCDACVSLRSDQIVTSKQVSCEWCDNQGCDQCRSNESFDQDVKTRDTQMHWGTSNESQANKPLEDGYEAMDKDDWGGDVTNGANDESGWGSYTQGFGDDGCDGWNTLSLDSAEPVNGTDKVQSILNSYYEAEYSAENEKYRTFHSVVSQISGDRSVLANEEARRAFVSCIFRLAERAVKLKVCDDTDSIESMRETTFERILEELGGMASDEARDGLSSYIDVCSQHILANGDRSNINYVDTASSHLTQHMQWLSYVNNRIAVSLSLEPKFASVLFALLLKQAKDSMAQRNFEMTRSVLAHLYSLTALEPDALHTAKHMDNLIGQNEGRLDLVDYVEFMESNSDRDPNFHRKLEQRMQVYALEVSLARLMNDTHKLKSIFEATRGMRHTVTDSRTQIMLKECAGQVLGDAGRWAQAYQDLYQAFNHAREVGDDDSARRLLTYAMIANLSSGQNINPLDAPEARAFASSTPTLIAIAELRAAYESDNVQRFESALSDLKQLLQSSGDAWGMSHLDDVGQLFKQSRLKKIIKAYKTIKFDYLSRYLRCSMDEAKEMVLSNILSNELNALIDDVEGVVHIFNGGMFKSSSISSSKLPSAIPSSSIALTSTSEHIERSTQRPTIDSALNERYMKMKSILDSVNL